MENCRSGMRKKEQGRLKGSSEGARGGNTEREHK